jgi:hypothetical protein
MANRIPKVRMVQASKVKVGDRIEVDERFWTVHNITNYDFGGLVMFFNDQAGNIWVGNRKKAVKVKR